MSKWYNDGIKEYLVKENECILDGWVKGRLKKENAFDKLSKRFSKTQVFELYIVLNKSYEECCECLGITRFQLRYLLNGYSIKKNPCLRAKNNNIVRNHEDYLKRGQKSSLTQINKWKNMSSEEKEMWSKKMSESHKTDSFRSLKSQQNREWYNSLSEDRKDSINKKRSDTLKKMWDENKQEILNKRHNSLVSNNKNRKQSGLFCRSLTEQKVYDCLSKKYTVDYDYIDSDRYPYYCDFYIKDLDLFIELQGHPSHGRIPYDIQVQESVDIASKLYGKWRDTYMNRDVEKLNCAVISKINLLRFYPDASLEENYTINNNNYKDIIDLISASM